MITYQYTQKDWTTFKEGIKREWAVTNGIGGYAGSSMIGAHSRTHQGYLIASSMHQLSAISFFQDQRNSHCRNQHGFL